MKHSLFSCVTPVKGARPYFDEALESLQNQGLGDDLEIIVQDADFLTQRHEGSEAQRGEKTLSL